jgi:hypothetical protein
MMAVVRLQAHNIERFSLTPAASISQGHRRDILAASIRRPAFARPNPNIPFFCPAEDTRWGLIDARASLMGRLRMTIKASGRSALLIAAGLFVCFSGQSKAAEDTAPSAKAETVGPPIALHQFTGQASRPKKHVHRSSSAAADSAITKKADAAGDGDRSSAISPGIANANAQLASTDTPIVNAARAMAARAKDILQAAPDQPIADAKSTLGSQVVSADQLNDVDRALQPASTPAAPTSTAPTLAMASAEAPAPSVVSLVPVIIGSNESSSSVWNQTSLIGKIFIGFGALLTMASAARMFMA